MSSRAAAKIVKQNIITTVGGTYVRFGLFFGKIDANKERQVTLPDQGPLAAKATKGLCFHLLELTRHVGLRGEKT